MIIYDQLQYKLTKQDGTWCVF